MRCEVWQAAPLAGHTTFPNVGDIHLPVPKIFDDSPHEPEWYTGVVSSFGHVMSSRHLHPLACRLPRAERASAVAFARARGLSVSGLIKAALRAYLAAQSAVDGGVHKRIAPSLSDAVQAIPVALPQKAPQHPKGSARDCRSEDRRFCD